MTRPPRKSSLVLRTPLPTLMDTAFTRKNIPPMALGPLANRNNDYHAAKENLEPAYLHDRSLYWYSRKARIRLPSIPSSRRYVPSSDWRYLDSKSLLYPLGKRESAYTPSPPAGGMCLHRIGGISIPNHYCTTRKREFAYILIPPAGGKENHTPSSSRRYAFIGFEVSRFQSLLYLLGKWNTFPPSGYMCLHHWRYLDSQIITVPTRKARIRLHSIPSSRRYLPSSDWRKARIDLPSIASSRRYVPSSDWRYLDSKSLLYPIGKRESHTPSSQQVDLPSSVGGISILITVSSRKARIDLPSSLQRRKARIDLPSIASSRRYVPSSDWRYLDSNITIPMEARIPTHPLQQVDLPSCWVSRFKSLLYPLESENRLSLHRFQRNVPSSDWRYLDSKSFAPLGKRDPPSIPSAVDICFIGLEYLIQIITVSSRKANRFTLHRFQQVCAFIGLEVSRFQTATHRKARIRYLHPPAVVFAFIGLGISIPNHY
ncbi:hypothetical protein AVEN_218573-1 [Araneus ventricosus]|uniref:Uncharacterized protein n=1 Tax=Araneus ventricosus TaxID=182803 RepID=A0A4Y2R5Y4_ARAVE|nr:hypothetical protein AVEN_218573-1 [Araneus ventricosus]